MKKIILLSLFFASNFVVANTSSINSDNLYIQADIGHSNLYLAGKVPGNSDLHKTTFMQRLGVGFYNINNFRIALDYTNFNKTKLKLGGDELTLRVNSLGLSGFYDFNFNNFLPYIGVRIALNKAKQSFPHNSSERSDYYYVKDTYQLGYGVLGGIQYKLNTNIYLNLGAEYNVLASDLHNLNFNLGIRYNF